MHILFPEAVDCQFTSFTTFRVSVQSTQRAVLAFETVSARCV